MVRPTNLNFQVFETTTLFITIFVMTVLLQDPFVNGEKFTAVNLNLASKFYHLEVECSRELGSCQKLHEGLQKDCYTYLMEMGYDNIMLELVKVGNGKNKTFCRIQNMNSINTSFPCLAYHQDAFVYRS
ncbi:hypothetical protein C5167_020195 [Papaver somniferum]|uniref:Uncharacterized protein n=1 Tax=Papaver somniferum TaxID=3469 RepID=A0A4Y7IVG5_PAPSO|nr:hypothetical protein C5167_020195 [Papaver somniferum]